MFLGALWIVFFTVIGFSGHCVIQNNACFSIEENYFTGLALGLGLSQTAWLHLGSKTY